ncbi:MAG: SDR family oxidoreductase [Chloroflexi bacterium]|nr:SDR family oxidoreductase [Chloroflexota bacterium]
MLAVRCDASKGADVEALAKRAVDEFGAIHAVCNNAGVVPPAGPVWDRTEAGWRTSLGTAIRVTSPSSSRTGPLVMV